MIIWDSSKGLDDKIIAAKCEDMKELAISEKVKVGCIIEGWRFAWDNNLSEFRYFGGSNIEISKSYTYHAEMVALTECIMNRFLPVRIFVTSQSRAERMFLCGECRQQLLEISRNCEVIVLNPDGSRKSFDKITVSSLLPFHKNVQEKNRRFFTILANYWSKYKKENEKIADRDIIA